MHCFTHGLSLPRVSNTKFVIVLEGRGWWQNPTLMILSRWCVIHSTSISTCNFIVCHCIRLLGHAMQRTQFPSSHSTLYIIPYVWLLLCTAAYIITYCMH
jgi:hypothetical protein